MRFVAMMMAFVAGSLVLPSDTVAQGGFVPGTRELFSVNFAAEEQGEFPRSLRLLEGNVTMVMKDGLPMLKASDRTTFLINLPERLPNDFTLEFDLIPKACCQPEDIAFEGTPTINQGSQSMNFMWHRERLRAVGGGPTIDVAMPPDVATNLPAQLSEIRVSVQGTRFQVFTNGTLVGEWPNRVFVRGRVLRIFLGGQNENERAVYLGRLRIATNSPPTD